VSFWDGMRDLWRNKTLALGSSIANDQDHRDVAQVSGRFVSDLLGSLERQGIATTQLLGDLPIPHDPSHLAASRVDWLDFVELMKRLEHAVGGVTGLEVCGAGIKTLKPTRAFRTLAGLTTSPRLLFRATTRWALRRSLRGLETQIVRIDENCIEIRARLRDGMRGCPQIFHIATGGARVLPRIIGLQDAVVEATVRPTEAYYRLSLPPSPTLFARTRRVARALFSGGSVLRSLECQQLELRAEHDALRKANAELAESEHRYQAFSDAAVDVLCELDTTGHVVFVSASIEDLLGYSKEQVTGSHYRLWLPNEFHEVASPVFESLCEQEERSTFPRKIVALHASNGKRVIAELSLRCFDTSNGERRLACVLRNLSAPVNHVASRTNDQNGVARSAATNDSEESSVDRIRRALATHHEANVAEAPNDSASTSRNRVQPLNRSLERLLAALEAHSKDSNLSAVNDLIRSSDAMATIVEGALVAVDGEEIAPRWIETRKLLESVQLEASSGSCRPEVRIEYPSDCDSLPQEIYVRSELLIAGLTSLCRCAQSSAPEAIAIELRVALGPGSESNPGLDFSIETPTPRAASNAGENRARNAISAQAIALDEAIAFDVARAHGGEFVIERHEGGSSTRRLRIPTSA
jgi:PAS domain S-box-containing protein